MSRGADSHNRGDFRAAAVEESLALLGGKPPAEAGISCCIPRSTDGAALRGHIKTVAIVCLIFMLSGIGTGGVIAFLMKHHVIADNNALLGVAFACSVMGICCGFVPTLRERVVVRKYLRTHAGDLWADTSHRPIHVAVEEAQTYGKLKLLAEDIGMLVCYPESACIIIEGVSYRYIIYGQDVCDLSLHTNKKTVLLNYRIGEQTLDLAILPRSLRAELKKQTLGSSRNLYDLLRQALWGDQFSASGLQNG